MNRLKQSISGMPSLPSFGKAPGDEERPTPPPLPTSTLALIQTRGATLKAVQSTFQVLHKTLAKQRPDARTGSGLGTTASPSRWVAEAMVEGSEELAGLAELSDAQQSYGRALSVVGELHGQLAELSSEFTETLSDDFVTSLEHQVDDQKLLKEALKEAEKKRSAFEAVMTKAEKSKKDRSEFEAELEAAEYAYSDECDTLARKADQLDAAAIKGVQALEQLVEDQLAYARNYVALLEEAKAALPSSSSYSSSTRTRSSSLTVPATRMSRSQSESSVRSPPLPSATSSLFSALGPNRSRRGTLSSPTEEDKKLGGENEKADALGSNSAKNRSRSGSMLERFALGNKGKKKDAGGTNGEEDGTAEADVPAGSGSNTPSRFAPSNLSMPTMPGLPTLGSLRKFGSPSGARFKALGDEPDRDTSPTSPTFSSSSRPGSSSSNSRPPLFKRTQTAPASTPSPSHSSPRNSSPRRAVPPLPPVLPARNNNGPVGQTFRAKWAYAPARASLSHDSSDTDTDDDDELALEQGDLVEVEKEVNADWWIGFSPASGRRGMFPSAYVVPHRASSPISSIAATTGSRKDLRRTTFATHDGHSTDDLDGSQDDHSADGHYYGGASTEDDSAEEPEEGLLGGGVTSRNSSPFRAGQPLPSLSSNVPLAGRRTAPRPPASRSRSSTVGQTPSREEEEASPFGDDQVSFALASGKMSR